VRLLKIGRSLLILFALVGQAEDFLRKKIMPAYKISYMHSNMPKEFIGVTVKHANSEQDALKLLGSNLHKGDGTRLLDSRKNILTILSIDEE
jgi:hypothetical protein